VAPGAENMVQRLVHWVEVSEVDDASLGIAFVGPVFAGQDSVLRDECYLLPADHWGSGHSQKLWSSCPT